MGNCDPLTSVRRLVDTLKGLKEIGEWAKGAFPDNLTDLLECVVLGNAESAGQEVYPGGLDPYDVEALGERFRGIYDSVANSSKHAVERIDANMSSPIDEATGTSGLWLSQDIGNTVYGLISARSEELRVDCVTLAPLLDQTLVLADELDSAIAEVRNGDLDLLGEARTMTGVICPGVQTIAGELRAIANDVQVNRDLGGAYCGATSLQDRIRIVLGQLPAGQHQFVGRALEVYRQLTVNAEAVSELVKKMEEGKAIVSSLPDRLESGLFAVQSEVGVHEALAEEFEKLCEEIQALIAARRYGDLRAVVPKVQQVSAVALSVLGAGPAARVQLVRDHPASLPYGLYEERLKILDSAREITDVMDGLQAELASAIYGATDRVRERIDAVRNSVEQIDRVRRSVESAATAFTEEAQAVIDELCVGALRRLLAATGYQQLERMFLDAIFGDIPGLLDTMGTTAGDVAQCLREFAEAGWPESGAQRFALERLTEGVQALDRVQDFIGDAARRVRGVRSSMTGMMDRFVGDLEKQARTALGAEPLVVSGDNELADLEAGAIPGDIRAFKVDGVPAPVRVDPDGFLRVEDLYVGAEVQRGMALTPEGYLRFDGIFPPAGTTVSPEGYLRAVDPAPRLGSPSPHVRTRGVAPPSVLAVPKLETGSETTVLEINALRAERNSALATR